MSPRDDIAAIVIAKKQKVVKEQKDLTPEQLVQEDALLTKEISNPGLGFIESL
jgi:hypothetical protein